ncbi:MAG: aldehyde dehydrogenase family protein, partial [Pseudomonadota bacterium]
MIEKRQFYVNGAWIDPATAADHYVVNPSNEEPCAVISMAGEADVDAAVAAAKAAFTPWMMAPVEERIGYIEKIRDAYAERSEEMAQLMSMEMGAPIDMSRSQQVGAGSWHIDGLIKAGRAFQFVQPLGDHAPNDRIIHEPIGVVAMITPWNWPMNQVTLKVIAGLIAGCSMVLKPSEESPLSALLFAEVVGAAGVPKGVFNLLNGDGAGAGTALTGHPDVDMVSFTGSSRAGKLISKNAADT